MRTTTTPAHARRRAASGGSVRGALLIAVLAGCAGAEVTGCAPYRIEHHRRPEFYEKAAIGELPDQVTLEDGTVIKYNTVHEQSTLGRTGDDRGGPFEPRKERAGPDGRTIVTLEAILPQHALTNVLTCVQAEEYRLLWEQALSVHTREEYERHDGGFEEFEAAFRKNRHDYAALLTRMLSGLPHHEVAITRLDNGVTRCVLRPQFSGPFKFRVVDLHQDGARQLRLLMIY